MPAPDEAHLLASCRSGHLESFAPLYDAYVEPIYRFIRYRVRDTAVAEDLTSQTFLRAMEKIRDFDGSRGSFGGWLYRIARNGVIDYVRAHKATISIDDEWDMAGDDDATASLKTNEAKAQVTAMLKTLDADKREILLLRVWDGLSYKEIAQITGKSESNCKVIASRTLAHLRSTFPLSSVLLLLLFPSLS